MSTITPTTNYVATLGSTAAGYANFAASQPLATISSVVNTSTAASSPASSTAYTINLYSTFTYNALFDPFPLFFYLGTRNTLYITVFPGYQLQFLQTGATAASTLAAGSWTVTPSTTTSVTLYSLQPV